MTAESMSAEALARYARAEEGRRRRRLALVLVVAAAVALGVALPPVRGTLAGILDVFRVERVRVVPVSEAGLAALQSLGQSLGQQVSGALARLGRAEAEGGSVSGPLTREEAARLLGFDPPLLRETPPGLGQPEIQVREAATVRFTVDAAAANAVLAAAGATARLPDALDGATIVLSLGPAAITHYPSGEAVPGGATAPGGEAAPGDATPALFILRTPAPRWEAPAGTDLDALRAALLSIPALPPDLRAELAALGDWRRVLPVPAPAGLAREVTVQGVPGAYLPGAPGAHPPGEAGEASAAGTLLWVRDGVLTAVSGPRELPDLLRTASRIP